MSELSALAPLASVPAADGAFYCLLRVNTNVDPLVVGERLVREHKVAVIPGTAFGMSGCYFRVAYGALQKATVAEGIGRLVNGLRAVWLLTRAASDFRLAALQCDLKVRTTSTGRRDQTILVLVTALAHSATHTS